MKIHWKQKFNMVKECAASLPYTLPFYKRDQVLCINYFKFIFLLVPNSYPISQAWTWLARLLNMKPRRLTPLLLYTFLDVCGHELLKEYKSQALKLFHFIMEHNIPAMPQSALAGTTRLELFLQETVIAHNDIRPPEGRDLEA